MKKLHTLLLLSFASASLQAQTAGNPDFEPFASATGSGGTSYTVGANLSGQKNAQGLSWFTAGSGGGQPVIASGTLSVAGLTPDTGNSVQYGGSTGSSISARWNLANSFSGSTAQTIYYSMAFEVTSLGTLTTSGSFVAGFNNATGASSTTPSIFGARLYARTATGGYNLGINKADGTAADISWGSTVYTINTTHFVVGAYNFSGSPSSANDSVSLWVDPSSSTFGTANIPTATATASGGANIQTGATETIASFMLREGSSVEPVMIVDELSIGVTWADVTPPTKVAPGFSNLSASQSTPYGSTGITLSGTVSGPGPVYPANGEMITVKINGTAQTTTIADAMGDFSFTYNPLGIPATSNPYTITYSYPGDTFLTTASDASTKLTVTQLPVTLTGSRDYDGTTNAAFGILSVANAVASDDVSVSAGSAGLAGSGAALQAITSLGSLTLGGMTASNYTLVSGSGSVTINPLPVVLTGTRPFDSTATASYSILSISNKVGSDDVSLTAGSATLAGSGAGVEPITSVGSLTLGGLSAGNYTLIGASGAVTVTGGTVVVSLTGKRAYDGTATAAYSILTIANKISGDDVYVASGSAPLAGATPGAESLTTTGTLTLGGAQASHYTLSGASGAVAVTALPVVLTGTRVYDGTTNAVFEILTISNAVSGDDVNLSSGSALLAGSGAGVEAIASFTNLALGGATAPDYTLTGASGAVTITALPVVLTGSRAYDGTASATNAILSVSNVVGSDNVTVASGSGTLAGANLGLQSIASFGTLALGGTNALDYTLSNGTGSVFIYFTTNQPIYEPFADASTNGGTSYNIGDDLIGEVNAQGLTWYQAGPAGNQPQPQMTSGNLSVSNLAASAGNSVNYGNGNGDSARLGLGTAVASGTIYYSLVLQVTSLGNLPANGAVMAGFNNSSGSQLNVPSVIATRLEFRLSGSSYNIGLDKTGTGLVWDTGMYNVGDTVFVVGSYTFGTNSATDDTSSLWINPPSSSFGAASPPTATLTSATGNDITAGQIASFLLREGSTSEPPTTVDELRVGYTWADVTPSSVITPAPFPITAEFVDSTKTNLVLTWASVPGMVYQVIGSPTVAAPINTWTNVGGTITATTTSTSATNPISPPLHFYEVVIP